ncbi:CPBP family intramembrane glutamic endopeptidase [Halosimplex aquaticum]|uniref:CPBP family intramembrane glutamic endopeptidase n=1 Tax=Halosimplex aquaticum TaxID=3026162 RepID=A0ABD5Y4W9_9EURY|nr:CPBP family intramembrane glutamic endopeptidase [Halosimplex aquaticum]
MSDSPSLRGLLWNRDEGRPRAFWRLGLAALLLLVGGIGGVVVASALVALAPSTAPPILAAVVTVTARTTQVAGFAAAILAAAWLIDRRRLVDLGLGCSRDWWADLAFGLALGVALPALVFALELAAGFLRVTGTLVSRADPSLAVGPGVPVAVAVALTFAYFVGVGVFEELLFRGYLLTNVAEGLDGWFGVGRRGALAAAVALSSLAFAAGHWMNPNVTPLAVANIALFGTLFAASYLLTERIAVAIGFHVTWNFAIASVFGFPVSGFTTPATVVAVEQSGPELVTGGSFGPEGGLVALVAFAVGVAALGWWVRLREGALRWRAAVARPTLRRSVVAEQRADEATEVDGETADTADGETVDGDATTGGAEPDTE